MLQYIGTYITSVIYLSMCIPVVTLY